MLLQIVVLFLILWMLVQRWQRRKMIELFDKFESTKLRPLPIIGHSYMFIGSDEDRMTVFQKLGREAVNTRDGVMSFWQGSKLYLQIADAKIADFILKNCLEKDDIMKISRLTTGNGSVFAPVNIWRPRRKVLAPTFSPKNLMQFVNIFSQQSTTLVEQLKSAVGVGDISMWSYINKYTLDSVCESTLGVQINAQKTKDQPFLKSLEQIVSLDAYRMCQPWFHSDMVFKMMPAYKQHKKCRSMIYDFIDQIIKAKRRSLKDEKESMTEYDQDAKSDSLRSFLELLIESSGGERGYSDLELQEETVVIVIAGTDTTAAGSSFVSLLLSRYPDVQDKVYEELQDVFGDSKRSIVAEDLPRLKYLDAVIKESLRLYPPVPVIVRKVDKEVTLPSGITLVKDTGILINIWAIQRNPNYWGDDVDVYRPERFIDTPVKHPAAFLAFSHGPRSCLGYQYAMNSMKIAMANLLRHYKILPASNAGGSDEPIRIKFDVMMKSVDHFTVQLKSRT